MTNNKQKREKGGYLFCTSTFTDLFYGQNLVAQSLATKEIVYWQTLKKKTSQWKILDISMDKKYVFIYYLIAVLHFLKNLEKSIEYNKIEHNFLSNPVTIEVTDILLIPFLHIYMLRYIIYQSLVAHHLPFWDLAPTKSE